MPPCLPACLPFYPSILHIISHDPHIYTRIHTGIGEGDEGIGKLKEKFRYPAINAELAEKFLAEGEGVQTPFMERILTEFTRVHQLTSGNTNEPYKRRSFAIVKAMDVCSLSFPTRCVHVCINVYVCIWYICVYMICIGIYAYTHI